MIRFVLSKPTPSLNTTIRSHWSSKRKTEKALAWEILSQVRAPEVPFAPALVTIERRSIRTPDFDNMVGGGKALIDVLKRTGAYGLGFIVDDSPEHLTVAWRSVKVDKLCDQCTIVTITENPGQTG